MSENFIVATENHFQCWKHEQLNFSQSNYSPLNKLLVFSLSLSVCFLTHHCFGTCWRVGYICVLLFILADIFHHSTKRKLFKWLFITGKNHDLIYYTHMNQSPTLISLLWHDMLCEKKLLLSTSRLCSEILFNGWFSALPPSFSLQQENNEFPWKNMYEKVPHISCCLIVENQYYLS